MSQFFSTENLKAFLENNPDSMAFAHLGARLIDEGEYKGAIDVCQKGLNKHPEYSFGHFILGTAHYHVKNYTDAKKELEKALAYDPNNPRAWEILSAINEILNLSDDSKESNLQSYLIDFLNKDASSQYIFEIDASPGEAPQGTQKPPQEMATEEPPLDVVPEEKDVGEMLDDVLAEGEEEYDFDKTLDDVFKDKEEQATVDEKPAQEELPNIQEDATSELVPSDKEGMVSADEFTTAIESFFSDYEKEEKSSESSPPEPEEETDKDVSSDMPEDSPAPEIPTGELADLTETDVSSETPEESDLSGLDMETDEVSLEDEAQSPPDSSQEAPTPDDELLDFQSFVTDVIQDSDEETPSGVVQEVPDLPETTGEETPSEEIVDPIETDQGTPPGVVQEVPDLPELTVEDTPAKEIVDPIETDQGTPPGVVQEVPDLPELPDEETPAEDMTGIIETEPSLPGEDSSSLEEMPPPEDIEPSLPKDELEIPKEEDFDSPLPPMDEPPDSVAEPPIIPDEVPDSPAEPSIIPEGTAAESADEDVTAKFSKPPILSPTLGEIYIAQGRFEEAINVFKQLVEKDPENSRYKRKISDLENIITKKKLDS